MDSVTSWFRPRIDRLPFVMIGFDSATVVDLLRALDAASNSRVAQLKRERDELRASGESILMHGRDIAQDVIDGYDSFHLPVAQEDAAALKEGAGTLLVFALLERSLRVICEDLASECDVRRWTKRY